MIEIKNNFFFIQKFYLDWIKKMSFKNNFIFKESNVSNLSGNDRKNIYDLKEWLNLMIKELNLLQNTTDFSEMFELNQIVKNLIKNKI